MTFFRKKEIHAVVNKIKIQIEYSSGEFFTKKKKTYKHECFYYTNYNINKIEENVSKEMI